MNIPIDTVVELLMLNAFRFSTVVCVHVVGVGESMTIKAGTREELRAKIHEYLLTLTKENENAAD